jgi:valyl-tRNA synthetase
MEYYALSSEEVWTKALHALLDVGSIPLSVKVSDDKNATKASLKVLNSDAKTVAFQVSGVAPALRVLMASSSTVKALSSKHIYPERSNYLRSKVDAWVDIISGHIGGYELLTDTSKKQVKKQQLAALKKFAQEDLTKLFEECETHLSGRTFLASEHVSCADVLLFALLSGLSANVLGQQFWSAHPNLTRWLHTTHAHGSVTKAFGSFADAVKTGAKEQAWTVAMPASDKKKASGEKKQKKEKKPEAAATEEKKEAPAKEAKKADAAKQPEQSAAAAGGAADKVVDPVKKAKADAKKAAKEAKKQKALAKKAAKEKAAKAKPKEGGASSKKAKQAEEAALKKKKAAELEESTLKFLDSQPEGSKKQIDKVQIQAYSPKIVEHSWYSWWEKEGFFTANNKHTKGKTFTIVIPPPNVTGTLHLGHALTDSIEDTIVRWKRMSGFEALWVPGTDHAGIATQTVVEKKLMREQGLTRHDLGREKFLEEVHKFAREKKSTILNQVRRLGSSVDWSRERFTMDDNLQTAVKEAFVQMYDKGLIYRNTRLVNWCCHLNTALSDIEVDYIDIPKRTMISVPGHKDQVEFGCLSSFAYPLEDGSGEIVVATTRIETMLGDTAVAVHPDDPRYKALHGKFLLHPVNGRKIPIITDKVLVDMEFGTSAVKITPAHDPNDYATGTRHGLEMINVFDDNGLVNDNGTGPFQGMKRFEARVKVIEYLEEKGLFRGKEDNEMRLGLCSRSKDVIEPMLKPQWWVDCKEMGEDACNVVRDGSLKIVPKEYEKTWFFWMENVRDWCISRQLWWGHRIPAFYVNFEDEDVEVGGLPGRSSEQKDRWVVGRSEEEAQKKAEEKFPGKKIKLTQDDDVLDTWFSSGIFPFSVFKWPEQTDDLKAFFPTQLLETGHDILFFWVARMVIMSRCLTGLLPFKEVFLHAMVRDAHGRKMSKSLGNVIDPIDVIEGISLEGLHKTLMGGNLDPKEVEKAKQGQSADYPEGIEECGTDALRFALVAYTSQGRDVNLDVKRVVGYRHWCNKLFNALRFAMMNLGDDYKAPSEISPTGMPLFCKWILSRLNQAIKGTVEALDEYQFASATSTIYGFWQYDVCDVFIELVKPVMQSSDEAVKKQTKDTLWACLEVGLRLLHPFMPFLTEELWQRLPKAEAYAKEYPSITISPYPTSAPEFIDVALEKNMTYAGVITNKIRGLRTNYGLTNNKKPEVFLLCTKEAMGKVSGLSSYIGTLSNSSKLICVTSNAEIPEGCGVAPVDESITAFILLSGLIDPEAEIKRLSKKLQDAQGKRDKIVKKIATPDYEKTPQKFKDEDKEKLANADIEISNIADAIEGFKKIFDSKGKAETKAPTPAPDAKKAEAEAEAAAKKKKAEAEAEAAAKKKAEEEAAAAAAAAKKEEAATAPVAEEETAEEKEMKEAFSFAPDEKVIHVGIVKKLHEWTSWIYKTRSLVLTNKRLFYYEPETTDMLGEFILSKDMEASVQDRKTFRVQAGDKERYMQTPDAAIWVEHIQSAMANL